MARETQETTPTGGNDPLAQLSAARADLNAAVKILKRAGVSQKAIANGAGYSEGYVTQLLSEKYAIERVTPAAVGRLVKSISSRARGARAALGVEEAKELDRLLASLGSGFVQDTAVVYGMDGEILDEREAAQYQRTEADTRLLEHLSGHAAYGVVQVSGAPGLGKTWTLANLARDAVDTHHVVWIDFTVRVEEADLTRPPHVQVGRDLRIAQQRYYRMLDRALGPLPAHNDDGAPSPRAIAAEIQEAVREKLGESGAQRANAVASGLARLLTTRRLTEGLTRVGSRAYADAIEPSLPRPDEPDNASHATDETYVVDDLGDDLCLLWLLANAATIVQAPEGSPALNEVRKLLVLIDNPDVYADAAQLMAMLREMATLVTFHPECREVLVVVGLIVSSQPKASHSSTVRSWYPLTPFTHDEVRKIIAELRAHGWFRAGAFASEDTRESLIDNCQRLAGLNRRFTCTYLDHCHRSERLISAEDFLDGAADADPRAPRWIGAWTQRAKSALDSAPDDLRAEIVEWLEAGSPPAPIEGTALDVFLRGFGLAPDPSGSASSYPLVQSRVRAGIASLLAESLPDAREASE